MGTTVTTNSAYTYVPIASYTLGSNSSNFVVFSSIPQTYTDLILVQNIAVSGAVSPFFRLNGDTGSNYSDTGMYGSGSTLGSGRHSSLSGALYGYFSTQGIAVSHFLNYTNTNTYKTILTRSGDTNYEMDFTANLWQSTAAINSITCYISTSITYTAGSTFALYGIKAA